MSLGREPPGPTLSRTGIVEIVLDTKRRFIQEVATAYWDLFPERAEEIRRLAERQRGALVRASGMSAGRTMRFKMLVPAELFIFIRRYWPDFGDEPGDLDLLYSEWPDLRIGKAGRNAAVGTNHST